MNGLLNGKPYRIFNLYDAVHEIRSRVGYGVSISSIADDAGISRSYLSEIFSQRRAPSSDVMERLGYITVYIRKDA